MFSEFAATAKHQRNIQIQIHGNKDMYGSVRQQRQMVKNLLKPGGQGAQDKQDPNPPVT